MPLISCYLCKHLQGSALKSLHNLWLRSSLAIKLTFELSKASSCHHATLSSQNHTYLVQFVGEWVSGRGDEELAATTASVGEWRKHAYEPNTSQLDVVIVEINTNNKHLVHFLQSGLYQSRSLCSTQHVRLYKCLLKVKGEKCFLYQWGQGFTLNT